MKQTHLKTLSARVDELEELRILSDLSYLEFTRLVLDANKQSKTIVNLAHFVPCDKNGVPLKDKAKRKCTQSQCIIHDACGACSCSVDYQQELNEAQKSVIFEGWEVFSAVEVRNKNDDRLNFRNGNVFYDIHDGDGGYIGKYLPDNPSLADLAEATTENPLKLK